MAALASPLTARALAGETVDALVYRLLGRGSTAVEQILVANPNLADLGLTLPRDHPVLIPVAATGPVATPMIQLWD